MLPLPIRSRRAQASIVNGAGDPSDGVTSMVCDPILPREPLFDLASSKSKRCPLLTDNDCHELFAKRRILGDVGTGGIRRPHVA